MVRFWSESYYDRSTHHTYTYNHRAGYFVRIITRGKHKGKLLIQCHDKKYRVDPAHLYTPPIRRESE